MRLVVQAHPGASRTGAAWDGEVQHLRITAHAVEGAANWALIEAVADALGVRRSAVSLASGLRSREKLGRCDWPRSDLSRPLACTLRARSPGPGATCLSRSTARLPPGIHGFGVCGASICAETKLGTRKCRQSKPPFMLGLALAIGCTVTRYLHPTPQNRLSKTRAGAQTTMRTTNAQSVRVRDLSTVPINP